MLDVANGSVDTDAVPSTPSKTEDSSEEIPNDGIENTKVEAENQDAVIYPSGARLALVLCAVALSIFLVSLDTTIVSTAIPRITDEFKSVDEIGW